MNPKNDKSSKIVFYVSLAIVAAVVVYSIVFHENLTNISGPVFDFLTNDMGWLYLIGMLVFLGFCAYAAFSKYGQIRLGSDDSRPEYSNMSWLGLLFGSGEGIGLVFFGVAGPLSHYMHPRGIPGGTPEAADFAMRSTFLHFGVLPWACYSVIGLSLAYFMFRKKKKGLLSSLLEPLIGEKRTNGWMGRTADILAVLATVGGIVTSLGLGTMQITAGCHSMFGLPNGVVVQIGIIVIISVIYISSAVSGIDKGIKKISDINLYVAIGLMIAAFLVGPKLEIINGFVSGLGQHLTNFFQDALAISSYGDNSWNANWTLFYWAWYIAWAPFVGIFMARISKGRTIKEYILGAVLVPALGCCVWAAIFGNLAISLAAKGTLSAEVLEAAIAAPESGLFVVLNQYPLGYILSIVSVVSLCAFFITSANSGVYVLSMLTSDGIQNPSNSKKIIWGILQSMMAIGLLLSGGLKPLQTLSLVVAVPFTFVLLATCASFIKSVKAEKMQINCKSKPDIGTIEN